MTSEMPVADITARDMLPQILRAREYRLYDGKRRYLDFWQDGGYAILGHRPGRARSVAKQQLDRGLLAAYPGKESSRLEKALSCLLPERKTFRWFTSHERYLEFIRTIFDTDTPPGLADPACGDGAPDGLMVWRPWLEAESAGARAVVPVLPMPGTGWLTFVATTVEVDDNLHPSDPVSPTILAAIKACVFALVSRIREFDTTIWHTFDSPLWTRRGPYLQLHCVESEFRPLYRDFLSHGMILAPEWGSPSIIPGVFDPGEVKPIRTIEQR